MTRQNLNIGTVANDTTGDTLRQGGQKINDNFIELYNALGSDGDALDNSVTFVANGISFEGTSPDDFETILSGGNPTADRTITLPDADGTFVLNTLTQTLTNKTLTSPILTTPQLNDNDGSHQYTFTPSALAADRNVIFPVLGSDDTIVFEAHTQTLTNKTLTAPVIDSARIISPINDVNGNELLALVHVAAAVNHIEIGNNIAGSEPTVHAVGTDGDITLDLAGKGNGAVRVNTALALKESVETGSGAVVLTKPLTIFNNASPLAMTLADGNTVGEVKKFINKNSGLATVTPANLANGTSFSIRQYGVTECIWDGSDWYLNIPDNYVVGDNTYVYVTA